MTRTPRASPQRSRSRARPPRSGAGRFRTQPHRAAARGGVVFAGPAANFVLAIVIYTAVNFWVGVHTISPRIGEVKPGLPAAAAGFQPGDPILSIDGETTEGFGG